jgi:hypothetical protein
MNNEDKKRKELHFLMRMNSLYPAFPLGDIEPSEGPDFIVSCEGTRIGIELTCYVRGQSSNGSNARKNEMLRDQIVKLAQTKFTNQRHRLPRCF